MKSLIFALVPLCALGCKDNNGNNNNPDMAMAGGLGPAPQLAVACSDTQADVYNIPSGLPAMDMTHRGDVVRCAVTESLTAAKANSQITAYDANTFGDTYLSVPPNVTSGFWSYRVTFRTLRNTPTGGGTPVEGDSAAYLLIPEKPLAGAPLVVFAHGSVGIAPGCAPTKLVDLSGPAGDQDFPLNLYRLAGYGYTVIAPDYSGYIGGQPPGYFNAEDEAHAVLDATRAAANLLTAPPDKVVIVGHSLGGHASLSAQSYAKAYGMKGTLIGIAVMAPLETSMALWAAAVTDASGLKTATDGTTILYAMEYPYAAGLLRGDTGEGLAVFQASKQQAVKDTLLGGACYDYTKLQALGAKPSDFFDANYISNVGFNCAANSLGSDCTQAPTTPAGDAPLWLSRWKEDRPALDAQSAPIVLFYGGKDSYARPGWAQCAKSKFENDVSAPGATTMLSFCYDAQAAHRDLVRDATPDYINQWIAARAGIGAEPAACTPLPSPMWTDPNGTMGTGCEQPPIDL